MHGPQFLLQKKSKVKTQSTVIFVNDVMMKKFKLALIARTCIQTCVNIWTGILTPTNHLKNKVHPLLLIVQTDVYMYFIFSARCVMAYYICAHNLNINRQNMKNCMHTCYILILMEIAFRSDSEYFKEKGIVYESIG